MPSLNTVSRHVRAWRSAWVQRTLSGFAESAKGIDVEFLPAVLEIQEAPPSPLGRAIGGVIVTVFLSAVLWTCIGHIDIVATAHGKILAGGHAKVIQPLDSGIV